MSYYGESKWEAFWDGPVGVFVIILGLTGFFLMVIAAICSQLNAVSCATYAKQMNIHTEYNFWTGCMIDVKGQLLPWSEVIPVEKDGRVVFTTKPRLGIEALDKQQH